MRFFRLRSFSMFRLLMILTAAGFVPQLAAAADEAKEAEIIYRDAFDSADQAGRRMQRGDWKMVDGVATCTQNDELYLQFKQHGPVIWYDVPLIDGVISFSYRPDGCKAFVFTINGNSGHVFRLVTTAGDTNLRAWPTLDNADHEAIVLERGGPPLAQGQWTDVVVEFRGPKATVKIGPDYAATVEHAAIDQPKQVIGLGFSFGTLSVRNVSVSQ